MRTIDADNVIYIIIINDAFSIMWYKEQTLKLISPVQSIDTVYSVRVELF